MRDGEYLKRITALTDGKGDDTYEKLKGGEKLRVDSIYTVQLNLWYWDEYLRKNIYSTGHVEADKILDASDAVRKAIAILESAKEEIKKL